MSQSHDPLSNLESFAPPGQPPMLSHIGVYTSGGDAPGMNAAIRSVVRTALHHRIRVSGIFHGYRGLVNLEMKSLEVGDMGNILQRGGTILKTARLLEFKEASVRAKAAANVRNAGMDALVCVGGDGSFTGARLLWQEHRIPIVGLPATIDNDIAGTDSTIGFDTAVNTALDAIDRIRETADSHERLFIVEVMGRDTGFIAIETGLAGGAEEVFFAESHVSVDQAIDGVKRGLARGKQSSILIAAEGKKPGRAYDLAEQIRKKTGWDAKVCILGHIQRGGAPSAFDRNLASRMGAAAVETLRRGLCDAMMSWTHGRIEAVPLKDVIGRHKRVPDELIKLSRILAK